MITGHQGKSPRCDWLTFATEEGLGLGILRLCSACLGTYSYHLKYLFSHTSAYLSI